MCPPPPPPPKKDPCPPFVCPLKCKDKKEKCTIELCDESGKRPCYTFQCIKDKTASKPCAADPNCPDEITLECKMEDGSSKCVQYVCKDKVKDLICDDKPEKIFKCFEECAEACAAQMNDYERGRQDMLKEISKCTKVCIPKPLPSCE
ncbi:unnamed protein product, partial [Notodromas monacha]